MSRVVQYLDCGCAVMDDGRINVCPSCECPPPKQEISLAVSHAKLVVALEKIHELQSSKDYPHVKTDMTRNIAQAALSEARKLTA